MLHKKEGAPKRQKRLPRCKQTILRDGDAMSSLTFSLRPF